MAAEDVWIPLVDEPIGSIVARSRRTSRASARSSTRRAACSPSARSPTSGSGSLLGQLLVDNDLEPYDGTETWIEQLMRDPAHRARVSREVRAVAEEIAADPRYAGDESLGPDEDARAPLPRVRAQAARTRSATRRVTNGERPL